jgi:hypothetical protein
MASALGAQAFTLGNDIFFGEHRFQPQTPSGQRLLAHELVHTIQQTGGSEGSSSRSIPFKHLEAARNSSSILKRQESPIRGLNRRLIQRAEVDDNPEFCFPREGEPLALKGFNDVAKL